jgi:two-component system NtrC family response regulator
MKLTRAKILVVDDEADMVETLEQILSRSDYDVIVATESPKAFDLITKEQPDLIITDLVMPELDGINFMELVKAHYPNIPVILLTGYATVDSAVDAMKKGASDYLSKPFFAEELLLRVEKCLTWSETDEENRYLRDRMQRESQTSSIIGQSRALWQVVQLVDKVAPTDAAVLLLGESGTGKDLLARTIHNRSTRRDGPFFSVNCAALTENLLESELFGHERGAFTGATETKKGIFEVANKGTLFLDEISETGASFQARLLRVVQDGQFLRVGGTRHLKTDVRLISSSNRDIQEAIANGSFRNDLFYRLSGIQIHVPPLRERKDDIPLLVRHFVEKYASELRRPVPVIAPEALLLLTNYSWPGNVRELRNTIERAVILGHGNVITAEQLPKEVTATSIAESRPEEAFHIPQTGLRLTDLEKKLVEEALDLAEGNQVQAARLLGISRDAFRNRLKKHGLL